MFSVFLKAIVVWQINANSFPEVQLILTILLYRVEILQPCSKVIFATKYIMGA